MKLTIMIMLGLVVLIEVYAIIDGIVTNIRRYRELKKSREKIQRRNEALLKEAREFLKELKK